MESQARYKRLFSLNKLLHTEIPSKWVPCLAASGTHNAHTNWSYTHLFVSSCESGLSVRTIYAPINDKNECAEIHISFFFFHFVCDVSLCRIFDCPFMVLITEVVSLSPRRLYTTSGAHTYCLTAVVHVFLALSLPRYLFSLFDTIDEYKVRTSIHRYNAHTHTRGKSIQSFIFRKGKTSCMLANHHHQWPSRHSQRCRCEFNKISIFMAHRTLHIFHAKRHGAFKQNNYAPRVCDVDLSFKWF